MTASSQPDQEPLVTQQSDQTSTEFDSGLTALAEALALVGRQVRDAVRARNSKDHDIVRTSGGDDIFGVDHRGEQVLQSAFEWIGERWPGKLICEGFDGPLSIGDPTGPWVFIVDPLDGTRSFLAGKSPAWVLLGAGRYASTLEDLEVGCAVEVPTARAAVGTVARAIRGGPVIAADDDLVQGGPSRPIQLQPQLDDELNGRYVTVVRHRPGTHQAIGEWQDQVLNGLDVNDHGVVVTGGQLMGLASGADAAVLDPRPLFDPEAAGPHAYDLAALVVARAAGVVIEAIPAGPLDCPLDTNSTVAWAGYANECIAEQLRPKVKNLPQSTPSASARRVIVVRPDPTDSDRAESPDHTAPANNNSG